MRFAFPRFVVAGACNTVLTYLLYLLLLKVMPYVWAYSVTYAAGIAIGYLLNAIWVFQKGTSARTALPYPLVYGLNYLLGVGFLWLAVNLARIPKEIAPILVLLLTVPIMYFTTRTIFLGSFSNEKKAINQ